MTDNIKYLIKEIDEYIKRNSEDSKNLDNDLSSLINELNNIISSSTYNADKLAGLSELNQEVLTQDEISIIKYFSVIGNINKDEQNISHIDITASQIDILKNIKNRLEDIIKSSSIVDSIKEIKNDLISNPTGIDVDNLKQLFEILDLSYDLQCKIILDLLNVTVRGNEIENSINGFDESKVEEKPVNQDESNNLSYKERVDVLENIMNIENSSVKTDVKDSLEEEQSNLERIRSLVKKHELNLEGILHDISLDEALESIPTLSELSRYSYGNLSQYSSDLLENVYLFADNLTISSVGEILKIYKIDFSEFIKSHYNVLLSKGYYKKYSILSNLSEKDMSHDDFMNNVEFFANMGLDVGEILRRSPSSLTYDSNVVTNNASILSTQYGVNVDEKSVSTLLNISIIRFLDKLIESSDIGYEWAKDKTYLLPKCNKKVNLALKFDKDNVVTNKDGKVNIDIKKATSIGDKYQDQLIYPNYTLPSFDYCNKVLSKSRSNLFTEITDELFNQENVKLLENNFKVDDVTYIIDSLRVSRPKVLRVLQTLLNQPEKDINDKNSINENEVIYVLSYESLLSARDGLIVANYKKYVSNHERVRNDG